jgi:hypothetical protein
MLMAKIVDPMLFVEQLIYPAIAVQFRTAAHFADTWLSLRAGDALHLAICADHERPSAHSTGG